jgi:hypothetical protein
MKTNTIVGLGAIALLAYLLLRKKKGVELSNIKVDKNAPAPSTPTASLTVVKSDAPVNLKSSAVLLEDIKVPVKRPIYIPAINSIPNVYDRGVGLPLEMSANGSQETFYNMSTYCTENTQNACRCSANRTRKYDLDVPKLP